MTNKNFCLIEELQNNNSQGMIGKTNWSQRASSSSSSSVTATKPTGSSGGGFMRLDQTQDLTSASSYTTTTTVNSGQHHQSESQAAVIGSALNSHVDQTVPPGPKIPHPPPQSTRPSTQSARKIRLPSSVKPPQPPAVSATSVNQVDSARPSHLSKATTTTATLMAYESSNEEDVHNHSSKTIIDLIQPNRVKMKHLDEVRMEKDSLNVDESMPSFAKSMNYLVF